MLDFQDVSHQIHAARIAFVPHWVGGGSGVEGGGGLRARKVESDGKSMLNDWPTLRDAHFLHSKHAEHATSTTKMLVRYCSGTKAKQIS